MRDLSPRFPPVVSSTPASQPASQAGQDRSSLTLLVSNKPVSSLIAAGRLSGLLIGRHNEGELRAALIGGLLLRFWRFDRKHHQKGADTPGSWVRLH